jgi:hypothetical protein
MHKVADDNGVLQIEIRNEKPVELADFTVSMAAFAEAFKDFASAHTADPLPDNMRLYVKSMRNGSIVAEMVALTEQAQFLLEHVEVMAAFVANLQDIVNFFLGRPAPAAPDPTAKQARLVSSIVEPIAKDTGAQLNIAITGDVHIHTSISLNSLEANAVQNSAARYVGPRLPASQFMGDQLLTLEQVKNSTKASSADRGIIEAISSRPVKLQFSSEETKRQVLDLHENPFQQIFQVNVEVRSVEGKPAVYRVLEVLDTIPKTD